MGPWGRAGGGASVRDGSCGGKEKEKDVVLFYLMVRHHGWNSFFVCLFRFFLIIFLGPS